MDISQISSWIRIPQWLYNTIHKSFGNLRGDADFFVTGHEVFGFRAR